MGLERASALQCVCACVCACVRASTLSNMNISETSWPITTKFYLKHHWGGGKAALGFDADQIRTLVPMATDSSHRVIMGKSASSRFLDCLIGSFSYLQVMRTWIKAWMSLNLGQIPPLTMELAALEHLKNRCHHFLSVAIDMILFKLAGNEDMHNQTTDYGVSCPWASEKIPIDL